MAEAEYIDLVDFTGREWQTGKRGVIRADEPPALRKLGLDKDHWTMKVKGFGSNYWRIVGSLEELLHFCLLVLISIKIILSSAELP